MRSLRMPFILFCMGLFVYNMLAGLYLVYLRIAGEFAGYLLLPAGVLHVLLAALLGRPALSANWVFEKGHR